MFPEAATGPPMISPPSKGLTAKRLVPRYPTVFEDVATRILRLALTVAGTTSMEISAANVAVAALPVVFEPMVLGSLPAGMVPDVRLDALEAAAITAAVRFVTPL